MKYCDKYVCVCVLLTAKGGGEIAHRGRSLISTIALL